LDFKSQQNGTNGNHSTINSDAWHKSISGRVATFPDANVNTTVNTHAPEAADTFAVPKVPLAILPTKVFWVEIVLLPLAVATSEFNASPDLLLSFREMFPACDRLDENSNKASASVDLRIKASKVDMNIGLSRFNFAEEWHTLTLPLERAKCQLDTRYSPQNSIDKKGVDFLNGEIVKRIQKCSQ
jgi:hypothetical protein